MRHATDREVTGDLVAAFTNRRNVRRPKFNRGVSNYVEKVGAPEVSIAIGFACADALGVDSCFDVRGSRVRRIELDVPLKLLNSPFTFEIIICRTLKCAPVC